MSPITRSLSLKVNMHEILKPCYMLFQLPFERGLGCQDVSVSLCYLLFVDDSHDSAGFDKMSHFEFNSCANGLYNCHSSGFAC